MSHEGIVSSDTSSYSEGENGLLPYENSFKSAHPDLYEIVTSEGRAVQFIDIKDAWSKGYYAGENPIVKEDGKTFIVTNSPIFDLYTDDKLTQLVTRKISRNQPSNPRLDHSAEDKYYHIKRYSREEDAKDYIPIRDSINGDTIEMHAFQEALTEGISDSNKPKIVSLLFDLSRFSVKSDLNQVSPKPLFGVDLAQRIAKAMFLANGISQILETHRPEDQRIESLLKVAHDNLRDQVDQFKEHFGIPTEAIPRYGFQIDASVERDLLNMKKNDFDKALDRIQSGISSQNQTSEIYDQKNIALEEALNSSVQPASTLASLAQLHSKVLAERPDLAGSTRSTQLDERMDTSNPDRISEDLESYFSKIKNLTSNEKQYNSSFELFYDLLVLHQEFIRIHPFNMGNGRVGRVQFNLLMREIAYSNNLKPIYLELLPDADYVWTDARNELRNYRNNYYELMNNQVNDKIEWVREFIGKYKDRQQRFPSIDNYKGLLPTSSATKA